MQLSVIIVVAMHNIDYTKHPFITSMLTTMKQLMVPHSFNDGHAKNNIGF